MTSTSFNVGMSNDRSSSKATSSSSDSESDEDYVPSIKDLKDEANDDDAASVDETDESDEATSSSKDGGVKRRKRKLGRTKKICESNNDSDKEESPLKEPSKNIDDIWNAFKKDVESERVKKPVSDEKKTAEEGSSEAAKSDQQTPKTKTITELFEFAGEAVAVEKMVPIDAPEPTTTLAPKITPTTSGPGPRKVAGGGLSSILGQIGKKNKLSILEKSKLDWNSFKKQEGIEEQLQTHNKGKDGFLEKQDFLQRTDLRRFEIEKAMRSSSRRSK